MASKRQNERREIHLSPDEQFYLLPSEALSASSTVVRHIGRFAFTVDGIAAGQEEVKCLSPTPPLGGVVAAGPADPNRLGPGSFPIRSTAADRLRLSISLNPIDCRAYRTKKSNSSSLLNTCTFQGISGPLEALHVGPTAIQLQSIAQVDNYCLDRQHGMELLRRRFTYPLGFRYFLVFYTGRGKITAGLGVYIFAFGGLLQ